MGIEKNIQERPALSGLRVLILKGQFEGREGICLGNSPADPAKYAVSPDDSTQIFEMSFETEFALLIDPSGPETN